MTAAKETYTPGYSANAVDFMARRTAETHATFVLPLLRSGQRLLDVGCGPGGITLGLAARVSPGEVVGIDLGGAQLERARQLAVAGLNVQFQEASIYSLPFTDATFDGVFSHALFEHLAEPDRALLELRRVLRPGGWVALRSPDWGGFVLHPYGDDLRRALEDYQELQHSNGGDVFAGRKLVSWLDAAGFPRIQPTASYEIYPSAQLIAEYLARQLDDHGRNLAAQTFREWATDPHAFFAQAWFEAIGWKTG